MKSTCCSVCWSVTNTPTSRNQTVNRKLSCVHIGFSSTALTAKLIPFSVFFFITFLRWNPYYLEKFVFTIIYLTRYSLTLSSKEELAPGRIAITLTSTFSKGKVSHGYHNGDPYYRYSLVLCATASFNDKSALCWTRSLKVVANNPSLEGCTCKNRKSVWHLRTTKPNVSAGAYNFWVYGLPF